MSLNRPCLTFWMSILMYYFPTILANLAFKIVMLTSFLTRGDHEVVVRPRKINKYFNTPAAHQFFLVPTSGAVEMTSFQCSLRALPQLWFSLLKQCLFFHKGENAQLIGLPVLATPSVSWPVIIEVCDRVQFEVLRVTRTKSVTTNFEKKKMAAVHFTTKPGAAHSSTPCLCNQTYGNRTQLKQKSYDWFR